MSIVPGVSDTKLFMGCIPCGTSEEDLRLTMSRFGDVVDFYYQPDEQGADRGSRHLSMSYGHQPIIGIEVLSSLPKCAVE